MSDLIEPVVQNGGIAVVAAAIGTLLGRAFSGTSRNWDQLFERQREQIKDLLAENHQADIEAAEERGALRAEIAEIRRQRDEDRQTAAAVLSASKAESRQCEEDYRRLTAEHRALERRLFEVERICHEQHAAGGSK